MAVFNGTANNDPYTDVSTDLFSELYGEGGADTLNGAQGDDLIIGASVLTGGRLGAGTVASPYQYAQNSFVPTQNDTDTLTGGAGKDSLYGGGGDDVLFGGDGDDSGTIVNGTTVFWCQLDGGLGSDRLFGGRGNDWLYGRDGVDELNGEADNDYLEGGAGSDILDGADGNDALEGGAGADSLTGGAGTDQASYFFSSAAIIVSLDGSLTATGEAAGDTFSGIENIRGSNVLTAGDQLSGDAKDNRLTGEGGDDRLFGRKGNDALLGGAGKDRAEGGDGNDSLQGSAGDDTLIGDAGNDDLEGGIGADGLFGGAGTDTAQYFNAVAGIVLAIDASFAKGGEAVGDRLSSIENVSGSDKRNDKIAGHGGNNTLWGNGGNDRLYGRAGNDQQLGGAGNDQLYGEAGDDVLTGGLGADILNGGSGTDWASYRGEAAAVSVNLKSAASNRGAAAGDTYVSIENIEGSDRGSDKLTGNDLKNTIFGYGGNDILSGGNGDDDLIGGAGNDTSSGGDGRDRLWGDAGNDRLTGGDDADVLIGGDGDDTLTGGMAVDQIITGTGKDRVVFNSAREAPDVISDFTADDLFVFKGSAFGGLAAGRLSTSRFESNTTGFAASTADRFIFRTGDDTLWFDIDGSGSRQAVLIADLGTNFNLTAGDILIV